VFVCVLEVVHTENRCAAAAIFEGNEFKQQFLSRLQPTDAVTLYRCGQFVDLCRGATTQLLPCYLQAYLLF
jgi:threonyl-tRNA synthetase